MNEPQTLVAPYLEKQSAERTEPTIFPKCGTLLTYDLSILHIVRCARLLTYGKALVIKMFLLPFSGNILVFDSIVVERGGGLQDWKYRLGLKTRLFVSHYGVLRESPTRCCD